LQGLHTAYRAHGLYVMASVPAKTAHKPPIKIGALMRVSY
jgi:hypothetical protein